MKVSRLFVACAAVAALGTSMAASAKVENEKGSTKSAEIPQCGKVLGTIALVDGDGQGWKEYQLGAPSTLLKAFVSKSGCFKLVNRGAGMKNVFDLARYLVRTPVPDKMKRRAVAFGSGQPTQAICSTLIAQAFNSLRYPILPEVDLIDTSTPGGERAKAEILHIRHYSLYMPRDFDTSPFFKIVKPRIEGGFDYHSLLWDDAGEAALSPGPAPVDAAAAKTA